MARLKYFVVHCLETPPELRVDKGMVEEWHTGPKDLEDGRVRFMRKIYESRDELPDNTINGIPVKHIHGRGWSRVGYTVLFHRNGHYDILTPHDDDQEVESHEMTWGAHGINDVSRHLALEGGMGARKEDDFFKHFTDEQFLELQMYLKTELYKHPDVLVGGHNDFDPHKQCPGFKVQDLMKLYGMEQYGYRR